MSAHPTAYLVLASQRSGSTLLVESLRATGVAGEPQEFFQYLPTTSMSPQPRQWFADVEDESILRLLDPHRRRQAGSRAARDLARLHPHRRPHPQRDLGRQADVEPDSAAAAAREGPAGALWRRACSPPSATSSAAIRSWSTSTVPTLSPRRFRSGALCRPGCGAGRPDPRRDCASRVPRRRDRPRRHDAARAGQRAGAPGSPRRMSSRSKCRIRCCGATSPRS